MKATGCRDVWILYLKMSQHRKTSLFIITFERVKDFRDNWYKIQGESPELDDFRNYCALKLVRFQWLTLYMTLKYIPKLYR